MANFCDTCPDKGSCLGWIEGFSILASETTGKISKNQSTASISTENGVPQGPTDMVVQYQDSEGGLSDPITIHGDSYEESQTNVVSYVNKIGRCKGPIETKKFLGFITTRTCAAPQS